MWDLWSDDDPSFVMVTRVGVKSRVGTMTVVQGPMPLLTCTGLPPNCKVWPKDKKCHTG